MPAPQAPGHLREGRPALGHVNLMIDTFIANANIEDLRAIMRSTLATNPGATVAFTAAARHRLMQSNAKAVYSELFTERDGRMIPGSDLMTALTRARMLYGAGLGLASLKVLAGIVKATAGHRWKGDAELEDLFAEIDADISQALQSTREELESGRVTDKGAARTAINDFRAAVEETQKEVKSWGGAYPFERAVSGLAYWRLA